MCFSATPKQIILSSISGQQPLREAGGGGGRGGSPSPQCDVQSSVVGGGAFGLLARLLDAAFLFAALLRGPVERSVDEAFWTLALEMLSGAHQGRVVDQREEELPVRSCPLGVGHLVLFLLLLDQLNTFECWIHNIMKEVKSTYWKVLLIDYW